MRHNTPYTRCGYMLPLTFLGVVVGINFIIYLSMHPYLCICIYMVIYIYMQIYISNELENKLRAWAKKNNKSISSVVAQGVELLITTGPISQGGQIAPPSVAKSMYTTTGKELLDKAKAPVQDIPYELDRPFNLDADDYI